MQDRNPALQYFLDSIHHVLAKDQSIPAASRSIEKTFAALERPFPSTVTGGGRLPVCSHLDEALKIVRVAQAPLRRIADAFELLEPLLTWRSRSTSGPFTIDSYKDGGHANAMIAGPGGFEDRNDVWVGVTLMAPRGRYPDHNLHLEVVYLVLSPGKFQLGNEPWLEPGVGGVLYNEPNVTHAMVSGKAPLFAIWCLWVDSRQ
jgi:hypothetical protein